MEEAQVSLVSKEKLGWELVRKDELEKWSIAEEDVIIPRRKTLLSAGYDLHSTKTIHILPNTTEKVPTGLKCKLNSVFGSLFVLKVYPRSSFGIKLNCKLVNTVGIVDADYYGCEENDGHIVIFVYNFGTKPVLINKGQAIAQGLIMPVCVLMNEIPPTEVRKGGFGSTSAYHGEEGKP